jgi:hypothetical protein
MNKRLDGALRTVLRGSDGLRTLVIATVPSEALADWMRVNEDRAGDPDYVQADAREGAAAARAAAGFRTVVMPLDLVLRLPRLGLEIEPARIETTDKELFEVVLEHLAAGRGAGPRT